MQLKSILTELTPYNIHWGDAQEAFVIANCCQITNPSVYHTPLPEMLHLNIHSALVDHIRFDGYE